MKLFSLADDRENVPAPACAQRRAAEPLSGSFVHNDASTAAAQWAVTEPRLVHVSAVEVQDLGQTHALANKVHALEGLVVNVVAHCGAAPSAILSRSGLSMASAARVTNEGQPATLEAARRSFSSARTSPIRDA